jgi:glycosyltransferase involved in cell wall biosynthesis
MKRRALLVSPLPPLETGLATYAARMVRITGNSIDWTAAYTEGSEPLHECRCLPLRELRETSLPEGRLFQLGNSPHCSEVVSALKRWGGGGILHEVNFHHLLRHMADTSGGWEEYRKHIVFEYGPKAEKVLRVMNRKAKSKAEYDLRLRRYPLFKRILGWCTSLVCLNGCAGEEISTATGGRAVIVIGHPLESLPEPLPRPVAPKPSDTIVLGMAGGFGYGRGWDHALKVVAELRRKRDCVLVAAGAGWPDPGLKWVKITGRLPEPEYQRIIRTFHIALDLRTGSCGETSGSLLEILRAGVPAIITDSGAFRRIPSGAVVRVPSGGLPDSAAAAASYLIDNPEVMTAVATEAGAFAETQGNHEAYEKQIHSILDALERKPSCPVP